MFTLGFWKAATERAAKTAAQAALLQLVIGDGFNAFDADWATAGGFALGGAVTSYLFSVASGVVSNGSPSLGDVEIPADQVAVTNEQYHGPDDKILGKA